MLETVLRIHEIFGTVLDANPDPEPGIFVSDLQDVNKTLFLFF
jgi:hypothetical protein